MKKYFLLFFVLLFFNVIWVYLMYIKQTKKIRDILYLNQKNIYTNLESGDILLFRSSYPNWPVKYIFGDEFTHSAIIYKDRLTNIPYIIEAVGEEDYFQLGEKVQNVKIIPAYTRLKTYSGTVCLKKLNKPLNNERYDKFTKRINDYVTYKFEIPSTYNIIKKCILLLESKSLLENTESVFCSMLSAKILEDLEIIKLTTNSQCMRPECFVNLYKHSKFQDGYFYHIPIEIKVN